MSRWVVHARASFHARHALTLYEGRPEEPHEHRWEVAVRVATPTLHPEGYALDFHRVRQALREAVLPLADSDLNTHPEIGDPTPSAENLATFLAALLEPRYRAMGGELLTVSVWEGPENRVDLELG